MRITVLNVDDNEASRYVRSAALRQAGFDVVEARTGGEALRLVKERGFSVILLDVNLPDIIGFEVARKIKRTPETSSIPILHISATSMKQEDVVAGLEAADGYLLEPVQPQVLVAFIGALLRSRELIQQWVSVFDSLADGVALLSAEGRVLRCNGSFLQLTGKSLPEVLGHMVQDVAKPEDCPGEALPFAISVKTNRSESLEGRIGERWFRFSSHPALVGGKVAGAIYILSDISERKALEQALHKQTAVFEAVTHNSSAVISAKDREGRYLMANPAALELLGRSWSEVEGRTDLEVIGGKDAERMIQVERRVMETGETTVTEDEVATSGRTLTFLSTRSPLRDEEGRINGLISVSSDITGIREATRDKEEALALLSSITDSAPVGFAFFDLDMRYRLVNRELAEMNGLAPEQHVGRTMEEVVPDLAAAGRAAFRAVVESRQAILQREFRGVTSKAPGEMRYWAESWYPVLAPDKRLLGVGVNAIETTELRRSENALRRSNEELQQFGFVISHDLQEPLRTITTYSQMLAGRAEMKLESDERQFLHFMVDAASRMSAMISDLLTYSRIDREIEELKTVSLEEAMSFALSNLSQAIMESGATITHDPLPSVRGDFVRLALLIQNLLSNAIKYRKPNVPLTIHVSAENGGGEWQFSVSDNGQGIDPAYHERVFAVFKRLHGREVPGTGIGLSVCRKIVERHGGRIWVESQPGEGSTFLFTLPVTGSARLVRHAF